MSYFLSFNEDRIFSNRSGLASTIGKGGLYERAASIRGWIQFKNFGRSKGTLQGFFVNQNTLIKLIFYFSVSYKVYLWPTSIKGVGGKFSSLLFSSFLHML